MSNKQNLIDKIKRRGRARAKSVEAHKAYLVAVNARETARDALVYNLASEGMSLDMAHLTVTQNDEFLRQKAIADQKYGEYLSAGAEFELANDHVQIAEVMAQLVE